MHGDKNFTERIYLHRFFKYPFQFIGLFDCDLEYLSQILNLFPDSVLVSNGVYYNKTAAIVTNPRVIVNSTYDNVIINAGGNFGPIEISKNSNITNINITNNTNVLSMGIGGGSQVSKLDVTSGSCVDTLVIKGCNGNNSTLDKIMEGSCINDFGIDDNATFNGYICDLINAQA